MSYAIGGNNLLGILAANSDLTYQSVSRLTEQASSGKIASTYAGLGDTAGASLSLEPALEHLTTWQSNIDSATASLGLTLTTLDQIGSIADGFYEKLSSLSTVDSSELTSLAASAQDALAQIEGLLNTKNGNTYLFSGEDGAASPLGDTAAFGSEVGTAAGSLDSSLFTPAGYAGVITTSPFATASAQAARVQVGENQFVTVGLVAGGSSPVAPASASPTGSSIGDILLSLSALESLSSDQADSSDFQTFVQGARSTLEGGMGQLADEEGVLGNRQSSLAATKTTLATLSDTLKSQISNAEEVDTAQVATALADAQTRLQASYELISAVGQLSLTEYLS